LGLGDAARQNSYVCALPGYDGAERIAIVKRSDAAKGVVRQVKTLDRRRLDQPQPQTGPRFRKPRENRQSADLSRHDQAHAPLPRPIVTFWTDT
jgi:hypothetical protein